MTWTRWRLSAIGSLHAVTIEIDFSGKVVAVTGGTKGVGRGIAQRFADAGATVAVIARREVDLPDGWLFIPGDLRTGDAAFAAIDAVVERCGAIDVLVNNAGGGPVVDTATVAPATTEKVVTLNLLSAIYCSQRANEHMQAGTGGSIVNIASVCGERQSPTAAAYGAAKAGLINYTRTTGHEWAPKVRVNAVVAGLILTDQSEVYYGAGDRYANVSATIPMGRLASPGEMGDACVYLASPMASYVTGAALRVDGGGDRPAFLDAAH